MPKHSRLSRFHTIKGNEIVEQVDAIDPHNTYPQLRYNPLLLGARVVIIPAPPYPLERTQRLPTLSRPTPIAPPPPKASDAPRFSAFAAQRSPGTDLVPPLETQREGEGSIRPSCFLASVRTDSDSRYGSPLGHVVAADAGLGGPRASIERFPDASPGPAGGFVQPGSGAPRHDLALASRRGGYLAARPWDYGGDESGTEDGCTG